MVLAGLLSLTAMFFVFDHLEQSMVQGDAFHEAHMAGEVLTNLLNNHARESQLRQEPTRSATSASQSPYRVVQHSRSDPRDRRHLAT